MKMFVNWRAVAILHLVFLVLAGLQIWEDRQENQKLRARLERSGECLFWQVNVGELEEQLDRALEDKRSVSEAWDACKERSAKLAAELFQEKSKEKNFIKEVKKHLGRKPVEF